jgi:hypothetical protein
MPPRGWNHLVSLRIGRISLDQWRFSDSSLTERQFDDTLGTRNQEYRDETQWPRHHWGQCPHNAIVPLYHRLLQELWQVVLHGYSV